MSNLKFLLLYLSLVTVFATLWNLGEFLIFGEITPEPIEITLVGIISMALALIIDTFAYLKKKLV